MKLLKIDRNLFLEFVRKKHGKFNPDKENITLFIDYINEYIEYRHKTSDITKKRQLHAKALSSAKYFKNRSGLFAYMRYIERAESWDLKPTNPYSLETIAKKIGVSQQSVRNLIKQIASNHGIEIKKGKFKEYIPEIFAAVAKDIYMP